MSDTPLTRIVRFGAGSLGELADVCGEAGISRPLLVASRRGAEAAARLPVVATFDGVRPHVPVETVRDAAALVRLRPRRERHFGGSRGDERAAGALSVFAEVKYPAIARNQVRCLCA